jgi:hypothetical protein
LIANVFLLVRAYLAALPDLFDHEWSFRGHEIVFPFSTETVFYAGLFWSWLQAQLAGRTIRHIYFAFVDIAQERDNGT